MNISRFFKTLLFALLMFLPFSASAQDDGANRVRITIGFTDTVKDGKCVGSLGFCLIIHTDSGTISVTARGDGKKVKAELYVEDGRLRIDYKSPLPGKGSPKKRTEPITIFEEMTLDATIAKKLGYKSITIMPGQYEIDYSNEKFGSSVFEVKDPLGSRQ